MFMHFKHVSDNKYQFKLKQNIDINKFKYHLFRWILDSKVLKYFLKKWLKLKKKKNDSELLFDEK